MPFQYYSFGMKMKQIQVPDGHGKAQLERLGAYLPELCLFQGPWLAGGTVRRMILGEDVDCADMDFFFPDQERWSLACQQIERVADARLETFRASTYRVPIGGSHQIVQMIKKGYYDGLMRLFKTFDYRVCQFATDGRSIVYPELAENDARQKKLRIAYQGKLETNGLYARLQKYLDYGFIPGSDLMLSVLTKVKTSKQQSVRMSEPYTYSDTPPVTDDTTGMGPGWVALFPKEKIIV